MPDLFKFDERCGTDIIKWHHFGEPLWVADLDFAFPSVVIETLRRNVEYGEFWYPFNLDEITRHWWKHWTG